jgi:hypothetical protein
VLSAWLLIVWKRWCLPSLHGYSEPFTGTESEAHEIELAVIGSLEEAHDRAGEGTP